MTELLSLYIALHCSLWMSFVLLSFCCINKCLDRQRREGNVYEISLWKNVTVYRINHDVSFPEFSAFDRTLLMFMWRVSGLRLATIISQSGVRIWKFAGKVEVGDLERLNFTCCCREFHKPGTTPDVEGNTGGILRILTLGRAQESRVHDLAIAEREVHHTQAGSLLSPGSLIIIMYGLSGLTQIISKFVVVKPWPQTH